MAPTRPAASLGLLVFLASGMLIAGTSTSLWMKWQDMQCVANCDDPDPSKRKNYEQPILQSLCMFIGEFLCLGASGVLKSRLNPWRATPPPIIPRSGPPIHEEAPLVLEESAPLLPAAGEGREEERPLSWRTKLLFAGPATFDILGTTSMNAALLWTSVSVYQMLKGALTVWVALFSYFLLGHRLARAQWAAVLLVCVGVSVVGYSNISNGAGSQAVGEKGGHEVLGVVIILMAQVFIATQFVIEEKIMEHYSVEPLVAVGYEGIFGFLLIALFAMPLLHLLIGRTASGKGGFFDAPNAVRELLSGPRVWGPAIVFAISVAFTNGFGLAVTKNVSATARSTIDTCRTCTIWIVSLALGWETLKWLQLIGFALLVYGTFIFNGITTWPAWTGLRDESVLVEHKAIAAVADADQAPLLGREHDD